MSSVMDSVTRIERSRTGRTRAREYGTILVWSGPSVPGSIDRVVGSIDCVVGSNDEEVDRLMSSYDRWGVWLEPAIHACHRVYSEFGNC